MAGTAIRKRGRDDEQRQRPKKRSKIVRKQREYHSSSEEEDEDEPRFQPINLADDDDEDDAVETNIAHATLNALSNAGEALSEESDGEAPSDTAALAALPPDASDDDGPPNDDESDGDSDAQSETSTAGGRTRKKRNDPDAFATSISRILGSKLTTTKRADPVLSRSKAASEAQAARTESRLEERARRKLREEKKKASERGRMRDVLAGEEEGLSAQAVAEREKRLRKTAQRGVVKLFNAFAAAHRKAEEVDAETKREGVVGIDQRREKVQSMSKEAFLDLVVSGGKKVAA